jgi:hypothetical protein
MLYAHFHSHTPWSGCENYYWIQNSRVFLLKFKGDFHYHIMKYALGSESV